MFVSSVQLLVLQELDYCLSLGHGLNEELRGKWMVNYVPQVMEEQMVRIYL